MQESVNQRVFAAAHIHTVRQVIQSKKNSFMNQKMDLFSSTAKLPYSILIEALQWELVCV